MATRQKTIEFASSVDATTLTAASNRDKSIAIYIPETVVAFRSVSLLCQFRGDNTTAGNLANVQLAIGTDSGFGTQDNNALGTPVANSGDNEAWWYAADVTAFFASNWSGTSNTWYVRFNGATLTNTINHSFKLVITYDYDDTSSTHIKTIRIPIESTRSVLTTSMQTIGGATAIPALTGGSSVLPEGSVTLRQAFLEITGNEVVATTTDFVIQLRINGGSTVTVWDVEAGLSASCWINLCYDITGETLTSASSLEMSATVTSRGDNPGGWVTVTYEFDPSSTTTVWNSLILGAIDTTGWAGGTTSGDGDSWGRDIFIQEPTTITLKESACVIGLNGAATTSMNIAVGNQASYTTYTCTAGSSQNGQWMFVHRIDAGGQQGTAFTTLARGRMPYECRIYSSTANDGWGVNGFLILNYTSGKATDGVGAHNQSRFHLLSECTNDNYCDQVDSKSVPIPESSYWLTGVCSEGGVTTDNTTSGSLCLQAERQSGEGEGEGWETFGVTQYRSDNENCNITARYASRKTWKRHPNDMDPTRLDIETSRSFRMDTPTLSTSWYGLWVTYHTITFTIAGDISGSGGGTINLYLHDAGTHEVMATTSRSGDGAYSFTWYGDVEDMYVTAYEDSTHQGRSDHGTAA